jgi:hypothetical protein
VHTNNPDNRAIQDVLVVGKALDEQESLVRKTELDRMAAMLSRLGGRGYCVAENSVPYGTKPEKVDPDPGLDFDFEKEKPQQGGAPDANTRRVAGAHCTSVGAIARAQIFYPVVF